MNKKCRKVLAVLLAAVSVLSMGMTVCAKESYTVRSGDNLKKIAREVYGDSAKWELIYNANKDAIKDPELIYANQILVMPDEEGAAEAEGYLNLGNMASDEGDYAAALEYYEKAAALNDAEAMKMVGYLYHIGEGVEQDYAMAMEWYQKAAASGNANAMNNIGYLYEYGGGVEQDHAMAMEWYQKAADEGNARAMNNIGSLYYRGNGVEQSYSKAAEWYEKAIEAEPENQAIRDNLEATRVHLQEEMAPAA